VNPTFLFQIKCIHTFFAYEDCQLHMQTTLGVRECETIDVIRYCTLLEELSLADQEQHEIPLSACCSRLFSTDCNAGEPSTFLNTRQLGRRYLGYPNERISTKSCDSRANYCIYYHRSAGTRVLKSIQTRSGD
jgi:hypothetical protein